MCNLKVCRGLSPAKAPSKSASSFTYQNNFKKAFLSPIPLWRWIWVLTLPTQGCISSSRKSPGGLEGKLQEESRWIGGEVHIAGELLVPSCALSGIPHSGWLLASHYQSWADGRISHASSPPSHGDSPSPYPGYFHIS